jgi:hypothetical protein
MIAIACLIAASLSCRYEHLTVPQFVPPPVFVSQGSPDVPVNGCARFSITLTGGGGISVTNAGHPNCGPIVPLEPSTAAYDPAAKTITLTIATANKWTREVVAPARVYSWNDSIVITAPSGLANGTGGTYLRLTGMDSTIGGTAATFKNARLWKYDTLLARSGSSRALWPGTNTRTHTVTIQVVSGSPTKFTVLFRVQAQNAYPVPVTPPDAEPAWLADDSAILHSGVWGNGTFSKYALEVDFKLGTAQAQMQAAIDSVRGKVIGGVSIGGIYLVQVPTDSTGALIHAAYNELLAMPQVENVTPYSPRFGQPGFRSPAQASSSSGAQFSAGWAWVSGLRISTPRILASGGSRWVPTLAKREVLVRRELRLPNGQRRHILPELAMNRAARLAVYVLVYVCIFAIAWMATRNMGPGLLRARLWWRVIIVLPGLFIIGVSMWASRRNAPREWGPRRLLRSILIGGLVMSFALAPWPIILLLGGEPSTWRDTLWWLLEVFAVGGVLGGLAWLLGWTGRSRDQVG